MLVDAFGDSVVAENPADSFGDPYLSTTNVWGNGAQDYHPALGHMSSEGETVAADAYVGLQITRSLWTHVFRRAGWDDKGGASRVTVHSLEAPAKYVGFGFVLIGYLDRQPGVTEMDALIAYLQMLGAGVDFSTYHADESDNSR